MIDESQFQTLADRYLSGLAERLEDSDKDGILEVDYDSGVLTIELRDGAQFVLTKHGPTRQVWLSSPVSGGLHFSYLDAAAAWALADGRALEPLLLHELKKLTDHHFSIEP